MQRTGILKNRRNWKGSTAIAMRRTGIRRTRKEINT
jgi:hypothetical protein